MAETQIGSGNDTDIKRVQRADEWRTPVSSDVSVVDNAAGNHVVSIVRVQAPHHAPGGYAHDPANPPPAPPAGVVVAAPSQNFPTPEVVAKIGGMIDGQTPAEFFKMAVTPAAPAIPDPAVSTLAYVVEENHTAAFSMSVPPPSATLRIAPQSAPPRVQVDFEVKIGDETQQFPFTYAEVKIENDVMVFVQHVSERLWLPKAGSSAEIAVELSGVAYLLVIVPIQFTHGDWQFGLAMINNSAQVT
jgi:hypothetical protein